MTNDFWEHLIDSKLCGGYLLRRLIGSTESSAVYLTSYGEAPAALKLTTHIDEPPVKEHPNILRLYAQGTCEVDGTPLRYLVTEYAEENLGAVIASRPLTPEETQDLVAPLVDALAFLHKRLLVHSRIQPSNILATSESIKLSMDSVRPIAADATPENDMRDLGLTLVEVLTQRRDAAAIAPLPQPFRDIVEHTLDSDAAARWTAPQVAMRLAGKVPPASRPAPPAEALAAKPGPVSTAPAPPPSAIPEPIPTRSPARRLPIWALPAAGITMLTGVMFVLAHGPTPDTPVQNAQPVPPPQPQVVVPPKPAPFDVPKKPVPQPLPPPKVAPKTASRPDARGWFVVVASYSREADAIQRAQSLGRRFPQFKLSVFPPSAIDTHYLVILGSGLTADAAASLRDRAIASGIARDTYIKKYPAQRP